MSRKLTDVAGQIVAFVPVYGPRGQATQLILYSGEVVLQDKTIAACLRNFWRIYSFDWPAYRKEYGPLLNQRNLLPWPADVRRTFAPLKLRRPLIKGDAAYGYVAIEAVEQVGQEEPKREAKTYLVLNSGPRLEVFLDIKEVHRHLKGAAYAAGIFWGRRLEVKSFLWQGLGSK